MISPNKFRPSATPETWVYPYTTCRLSTLITAARFQCLDERFRNPSGSLFTKTQRTKLLKRLRTLALDHKGETLAENRGFNRENALYAYRVAFPWGKAERFDPTPPQLKQALRDGYFVSISGNVDDVPGSSKLDDKVNDVPHEIGLARLSKDESQVLVYEPMTNGSFWAKWEHVKLFASEFQSGGRYFAIRFKIGYGTLLAQHKRTCATRRQQLKSAVERAEAAQLDAETELRRLETEYDELTADFGATEQLLAECQTHQCEDEWNDALEAAISSLELLKT